MDELTISLICFFLLNIIFLVGLISHGKAEKIIGEIMFGIGIGFISGGAISFNIISQTSSYLVFLISGAYSLFIGSLLKLFTRE